MSEHRTFGYTELVNMVKDYVAAYRRHDKKLVILAILALLPAAEAMFAAYLWRDGQSLAVLNVGGFAFWWTVASLIAALLLALHIVWSSKRFYREAAPRCPRCTAVIRDLDDLMMSAEMQKLRGTKEKKRLLCDACNHLIAESGNSVFGPDVQR